MENRPVQAKSGDLKSGDTSGKNTDFSNGPQPFTLLQTDQRLYGEFLSRVDDKQIMAKLHDKNIYEITVSNKGGLVMPVVIEWTFKDGTKELETIPAEVWRFNEKRFTKVFLKDKEVANVMIDPNMETADINIQDNIFPKMQTPSRFDEFKNRAR